MEYGVCQGSEHLVIPLQSLSVEDNALVSGSHLNAVVGK